MSDPDTPPSLLDAFDAPCTRRETSDYGIDQPIMVWDVPDVPVHDPCTCPTCGMARTILGMRSDPARCPVCNPGSEDS